jgi:4'-phosphopantetheinyl transferase EntD
VSAARLAPEVAALFPGGVVAAELVGDGDPGQLSQQERQALVRAAPKRLKEFAAGRQCAQLALAQLGIKGFPLLPGKDRQPQWPEGITGSITHTEGYCAAVVARRSAVQSLGVDCEVIEAVHEDLWARICGAGELAWLKRLPAGQRTACAALVFAAKEGFYKCQYPLTGEWLDFTAVGIELTEPDAPCGEFRVVPQRPLKLEACACFPLAGRFRFHESWVSAAIALV